MATLDKLGARIDGATSTIAELKEAIKTLEAEVAARKAAEELRRQVAEGGAHVERERARSSTAAPAGARGERDLALNDEHFYQSDRSVVNDLLLEQRCL